MSTPPDEVVPPAAGAFFRRVLDGLLRADIPFLVGGAYAFACYTGIRRHTKDFDLFIKGSDLTRTLEAVDWDDCSPEVTAPHWLAKVRCEEHFVDFVFATGNGVSKVDDGWFERARHDVVLDTDALLCSPEDILWTKAFIQERERFDGADVAHLILHADLDWDVLIELFGENWQVLYAHLVLFTFIYPSERSRIPPGVMKRLADRMRGELTSPPPRERVCRGTLLSRSQYRTDVEDGFLDARLEAEIGMSSVDATAWSDAADDGPKI